MEDCGEVGWTILVKRGSVARIDLLQGDLVGSSVRSFHDGLGVLNVWGVVFPILRLFCTSVLILIEMSFCIIAFTIGGSKYPIYFATAHQTPSII